MDTTLDGEFQRYAAESGAYIREHFFGPDPRLQALVGHLSDDDLQKLRRGGHDYRKLYAAYATAVELRDAPTVILAHTVKGWTLPGAFEGRNPTHQMKKLTQDELKTFRDRLELPIKDEDISEGVAALLPPRAGLEGDPVHAGPPARPRRGASPSGASLPTVIEGPKPEIYDQFAAGSTQAVSTTMAFVRLLRDLMKDKKIGKRIVPIVPDEARTFGMESLFPQFKIYAAHGQLYEPVDAKLLLGYVEAQAGQVLEEGITEAGSMGSWTAAATSYATHGEPMIPFFLFYSMFGFQRIGDLIWSAGDQRARGFLLGATAGRTTLNGEGLQHEDGHSLLLAATNPACLAYDPAFAFEVAAIVRRACAACTTRARTSSTTSPSTTRTTRSPPSPRASTRGSSRGCTGSRRAPNGDVRHRAQLLASGPMVPQALRAQELLAEYDVSASVWSATSYKQLRMDALECRAVEPPPPRRAAARAVRRRRRSAQAEGPVVAVSDFMKLGPDQIARWIHQPFVSLGTDGFGRSDTREALRRHFEVDAEHLTVAALSALADMGEVKPETVTEAIRRFEIDPDRKSPYFA